MAPDAEQQDLLATAPDPQHPPVAAPYTGPRSRVRLTVAYDGAGFHGFWPNDGVATVGGTLQSAIEQVLDQPIAITCAGRTDAGVHAWGQVVSFDAPQGVDLLAFRDSLNALCGPAIVVREAAVAPDDFDARNSATARAYRYTVLNRPVPDPFLAATTWHVHRPLDLSLLRLGCDPLVGHHDFTSFCRKPPPLANGEPRSLMRRVTDARWVDLGDGLLRFDIEASSFCHTMVRSIVGALVAMGDGRLRPGDMRGLMAARDRRGMPAVAPAHGLCLWEVRY
ncbi:MAG: tRNA pseudouridine(38-40) synthase TruA [Acidimicrobiales bacterium]|nr:tRNA pseudouridine(38-40) synthase TruA [Acidimicrobiales bacterium]